MPPKKRRVKPKLPEEDVLNSDDEAGPSLGKRKKARNTMVSTYFIPQTGGSNRTLADLKLDHQDDTELRAIHQALPDKHASEKAQLQTRHEALFGKWWAQLRAGSSLLFYGFGSKRQLLQNFAKNHTTDGACFTVDGLTPGLSARRIVIWAAALAKITKPNHYKNTSKVDLFDLIRSEHPVRHIYIVIHNIDGPGLRDAASQRLLSELAALPNIHVVASVDHVNAPLLWDMQSKDRFRWLWHNVTNYTSYKKETLAAGIPSLLAGRSEEVSRQSAEVVLASLSNNAREVFRLMADAQLDPEGDHGISFERLFTSCRDRFLVSSDALLKAFLVEFKDHDLLSTRRGAEGTELMFIPLSDEALTGVLEALTHMQGGGQAAGS